MTAVPDAEAGFALAKGLVAAKLAACVQVLPPMMSFYEWDGSLQSESENLLLIKTLPEKYAEIEAFISANHAYEVPEIAAVEAAKVYGPYLEWMTQGLGQLPEQGEQ